MKTEFLKNKIIIKPNWIFMFIGGFAVLMSLGVASILISFFPLDFESEDILNDIIGTVFLSIFVILFFSLGLSTFISNSNTITIDEDGVSRRGLSSKKSLSWTEIKDYGIYYFGQTRGEGNTYNLYFSTEEQTFKFRRYGKIKGKIKGKLKGESVSIYVTEDSFDEVTDEILPFCSKFIKIVPFVVNERFH